MTKNKNSFKLKAQPTKDQMTKISQADTEQSLFYTAINALRIAGQEKLADDLDQRMENLIDSNNKKIAIFVDGGIVQAIRSNIPCHKLEIEIVDKDNEPDEAEDRWEDIQNELDFGNY